MSIAPSYASRVFDVVTPSLVGEFRRGDVSRPPKARKHARRHESIPMYSPYASSESSVGSVSSGSSVSSAPPPRRRSRTRKAQSRKASRRASRKAPRNANDSGTFTIEKKHLLIGGAVLGLVAVGAAVALGYYFLVVRRRRGSESETDAVADADVAVGDQSHALVDAKRDEPQKHQALGDGEEAVAEDSDAESDEGGSSDPDGDGGDSGGRLQPYIPPEFVDAIKDSIHDDGEDEQDVSDDESEADEGDAAAEKTENDTPDEPAAPAAPAAPAPQGRLLPLVDPAVQGAMVRSAPAAAPADAPADAPVVHVQGHPVVLEKADAPADAPESGSNRPSRRRKRKATAVAEE